MSLPTILHGGPEPEARPQHNPSAAAADGAAFRLAQLVRDRLRRGEPVHSEVLFQLAASAYGGTPAEGAFTARDAYDAAELGFHLLVLERRLDAGVSLDDARRTLSEVERLWALAPSQTRRSLEQQAFQQFSTPAPYAYVCAWAAALRVGDVVLEPSAGTGALLTWALAAGAKAYANELAPRRADLLQHLLVEAGREPSSALFRENAEHLDAVLPAHVRPSIVLMNPPFSQTAGRMGSRRVPEEGASHVLQALRRLTPRGRLVAVVGRGVRRGSKSHQSFFEALDRGPYALRADVEVDGRVYQACGTTTATRVLVVDKARDESTAITGRAESVEALLDLLVAVREHRTASRSEGADEVKGGGGEGDGGPPS